MALNLSIITSTVSAAELCSLSNEQSTFSTKDYNAGMFLTYELEYAN